MTPATATELGVFPALTVAGLSGVKTQLFRAMFFICGLLMRSISAPNFRTELLVLHLN